MIEVQGLSKRFGDVQVLTDINATFSKGLVNQIIGMSGSGKSVLAKCMVGLHKPEEGKVLYEGRSFHDMDIDEKRGIRQEIGMLFQGAALFDSMSVLENVMFPLKMFSDMPRSEMQDRAHVCLDRVNIVDKDNLFPAELSGGMQKRVALARGLVRDPEFILYDEPTTGLDPILAAAMDKLIMETGHARPDITSIVISHDMHAVLHIADKVAMMVEGEIYAEGDRDYFKSNDDPLIRQFLTGSLDGPMKV